MKKQYIMGINSAYHESSVAILCNGEIIAAVEEERFNRVKHAKEAKVDNASELPINAIEFCLREASLKSLEEIEYIGYSFNPKNRLDKNIDYRVNYLVDEGDFGTKKSEETFYQSNLRVEQKLREMGFKGQFYYLSHHLCHGARPQISIKL